LPPPPRPESRRQRADKKRADAGALHLRGLSYRQIAEKLRLGNPGNAHRLVQQFYGRVPEPDVIATQRKVSNLRLDEIWRVAWREAEHGNVPAMRVLVEVERSRRQLNGLDRPVIMQLDGPGEGPQQVTRTLAEVLPPEEFTAAGSVRDMALRLHRALPPTGTDRNGDSP
jgi:hypothetical protein